MEACITRSLEFTSIQLVLNTIQQCFKYLVLIRFQVSPPQPPPSPSPLSNLSTNEAGVDIVETSCTKNEVSS